MKRNHESATLDAERPLLFIPEPQEEHHWLLQLEGEWTVEVEILLEPGQPSMRSKGTESIQAIGPFWIVAESTGTFMDKPFHGVMTLGYDASKQRYIGTWVDSSTSHLWLYDGTLEAAQNRLTLTGEGPSAVNPRNFAKFREVIELKSPDYRTFTSSMRQDNGKWAVTMINHYRRIRG
jgi:hypothetical protein